MKKLLTLLLTLIMVICLVNLNNKHINADENSSKPLTITAIDDGITTIKLNVMRISQTYIPPALQYSTNNGKTWNDYDYTIPTAISLTKGQKVQFKTKELVNKPLSTSYNDYIYISAEGNPTENGRITVSGNIMSLVCPNFSSANEIPGTAGVDTHCFYSLFNGCTKLTSIDGLKLPAKILKDDCYSNMFAYCTGLTSIPEKLLPAVTLTKNCYISMFISCSGLTTIPEKLLPATKLADACYSGMFAYCGNLTSLPLGLLPAKKLVKQCYNCMFQDCKQLTNIPDLPATMLAEDCYGYMFAECSNLPNGLSETETSELTEMFTIPTKGTIENTAMNPTDGMFYNVTGITYTPTLSEGSSLTYYRKPTPKPEPTPSPEPSKKDESCEKVIGPTWHWNNTKGICEDYGVVGTSTR